MANDSLNLEGKTQVYFTKVIFNIISKDFL